MHHQLFANGGHLEERDCKRTPKPSGSTSTDPHGHGSPATKGAPRGGPQAFADDLGVGGYSDDIRQRTRVRREIDLGEWIDRRNRGSRKEVGTVQCHPQRGSGGVEMRTGVLERAGAPDGRHYPGIAHLLDAAHPRARRRARGGATWAELPIAASSTSKNDRPRRIVDRVVGNRNRHRAWRSNRRSAKTGLVTRGTDPQRLGATCTRSREDVKDAPPFAAVVSEMWPRSRRCVPAAYQHAASRAAIPRE